jgi:hypothetical protein
MFPVCAGMNRFTCRSIRLSLYVPRVCGDEPMLPPSPYQPRSRPAWARGLKRATQSRDEHHVQVSTTLGEEGKRADEVGGVKTVGEQKDRGRKKKQGGRRLIVDEFTSLHVSRQRKYQLRKRRDRRCTVCGRPVAENTRLCRRHLMIERDRGREKYHRNI